MDAQAPKVAPNPSTLRERAAASLAWLPTLKSTLPKATWELRHRWVVGILTLQVVLIPAFGVLQGYGVGHSLLEAAIPGVLAGIASVKRLNRALRGSLAAVGLMVVSGIVVHLSHGAIEAHFHFFIMIPIVALYESWIPFGLAVGYVLVQHGVVGTLDPHSVYNHGAAHENPWKWAAVHAVAFASACGGALVNWRLHEEARKVEQQLTENLNHQAHHDVLTGLPNRAGLARHLERLQGEPHALLLLDLDRFKEVNDTLGHGCGDELLIEVARRLQEHTRPGDLSMRLGGDEFAVVLAGATSEEGVAVAERLQESLSAPVIVQGIILSAECSIGVAATEDVEDDNQEQLLLRADVAMYASKRGGRGPQAWNPGLEVADAGQLNLLGELKGAITGGQLELHYQPKVRVAGGEVVGVEALIRWNHPQLGLVGPNQFLAAAENTGLIHPLTEFVINEATRQAAQWRAEGLEVAVAVNLSARSLGDDGIVATVAHALTAHQLPPQLLELELTESSLQEDPEQAVSVLQGLAALGVSISLDDFGAGYTSVSQLEGLPITTIKVDRSLVHLAQERQSLVLASLVKLGHDLGLIVVAEGVENADTVELLAKKECDIMQGYHIARPMPAQQIAEWLRKPAELPD